MPRFKGTFTQSVEGIEKVEVTVTAPDEDTANEIINSGEYERYRVVDKDFVTIKRLGGLVVEEIG